MNKDIIKVMVIDDSLSIRLFLKKLFHDHEDFEIIASAEHPIDALEQLKKITPDVITLDVEMPEMDGITFLKKIMRLKPLPIVMISTLTNEGSATAIEALDHGAVDVVGKPSHKASELESSQQDIIEKVRAAAYAKVGQKTTKKLPVSNSFVNVEKEKTIDEILPSKRTNLTGNEMPLIAIASSTGGPPALKEVLKGINDTNTPPIVIVQHIGIGFSKSLADNINSVCTLQTQEAADGAILQKGNVYIAPSHKHLSVGKNVSGHYIAKLLDLDKVNRHKPSADILFRAIKEICGKNALGIVLTGMGNDGAACLKELCDVGAQTLVQNEESCVVYGMPRAALKLEPKHRSLNLKQITKAIKDYSS